MTNEPQRMSAGRLSLNGVTSENKAIHNLVPRALFPGFGSGAGKGPGIGRPIRYFDWLIDLGNSFKKMAISK